MKRDSAEEEGVEVEAEAEVEEEEEEEVVDAVDAALVCMIATTGSFAVFDCACLSWS